MGKMRLTAKLWTVAVLAVTSAALVGAQTPAAGSQGQGSQATHGSCTFTNSEGKQEVLPDCGGPPPVKTAPTAASQGAAQKFPYPGDPAPAAPAAARGYEWSAERDACGCTGAGVSVSGRQHARGSGSNGSGGIAPGKRFARSAGCGEYRDVIRWDCREWVAGGGCVELFVVRWRDRAVRG